MVRNENINDGLRSSTRTKWVTTKFSIKNDQLRFIIATQLQISALNNHITMLLYPEQSTMHLNFVSATKLHKLYPYNSSNAVTFYY
jgi:hypothetical protein